VKLATAIDSLSWPHLLVVLDQYDRSVSAMS
jgi:hypothetical protein